MEDRMEKTIQTLRDDFLVASLKVGDAASLEKLKIQYLGRKGELAELLKELKHVSEQDRPKLGQRLNEIKKELTETIERLEKQLGTHGERNSDRIDISAPGKEQSIGRAHPVTQMMHHIWEVFSDLNFQIVQGPEVETDYYNFEALNVPLDHPARDMQDTFFLPGSLLLRTHTTATDVRYMEKHKPPIRIIVTGKTYRRDSDVTHTPMFHQFDGAVVDTNITMAHLRGTLHMVMQRLLEAELSVRFRASYFPFVEPGAEFDVSCTLCHQKGCQTCKYTGWLEMGGCGMFHPKVLEKIGYDPNVYQGYAFGFGIERPFMIKHKVPDLRLFFENDLRFLEQF